MNAQAAIARARRDLTVSAMVKFALLIGALIALFVVPAVGGDNALWLVGIGAIWLILSFRSMKGSREIAMSPSLIANGRYEEAERQIEDALNSFNLFRTVKLLSLHHLAMLRHAQRRYQDAAAISRALLGQRLGPLSGLTKQTRLILADALLAMNDLRGAHEAIAGLYQHRLSLSEAMNLLQVELDYQARIGAWQQMAANLPSKVQLAELLPAQASAQTQALLALAARKTGRDDWAELLRRRAELLADVTELCKSRQVLWELWQQAQSGE